LGDAYLHDDLGMSLVVELKVDRRIWIKGGDAACSNDAIVLEAAKENQNQNQNQKSSSQTDSLEGRRPLPYIRVNFDPIPL
jgi:hypothetical protein